MSSCTIFVRSAEPHALSAGVRERAAILGLEVHLLEKKGPRDKFTRIIIGAYNFVQNRKMAPDRLKEPVLSFILGTTVLVGVPDASPNPYPLVSVATLIRDAEAMVFDGLTMRDAKGLDLLPDERGEPQGF